MVQAKQVAYTPAAPGNWNVVPTAVQAALDGLAARPFGTSLIFDPTATPGGIVYATIPALCAALALLPEGSAPSVTFRITGTFNMPSVGMPVSGWYFHGCTWRGFTPATGTTVVNIPDGVIIDCGAYPFSIENGLRVISNASSEYGVFQTTANPRVFEVGEGADFIPLGTSAPIVTPGLVGQTFQVIAFNFPSLNVGGPPATAPWVSLHGTDALIAAQQDGAGQLPSGWVIGPATATLEYLDGLNATHPPIAGFSGTIIISNQNNATNLPYVPAVPGDWNPVPALVAPALDQLAANNGVHRIMFEINATLCQAQPPGAGSVSFSAVLPASAEYFSLLLGDTPTPVSFDDPLHKQWFATVTLGVFMTGSVEVDVGAPTPLPVTFGTLATMAPIPIIGQSGGVGGQTLDFTVSISTPAPAQAIGSVDLTTLTYGPGGSLDGKNFGIFESFSIDPVFTISFVAPASPAAVVAQINATTNGTGHTFTDYYTASINGSNELVITSVDTINPFTLTTGTPDALAVLGLVAQEYPVGATPGQVNTATVGSISMAFLYF